ncbi:IS3 family transposase [Nocardia sp. GAS34]|uniref:IS3 family transposase n=1 Tax=unclassified Nocardia TaxID=2637762 RepID=UPI003D2233E9
MLPRTERRPLGFFLELRTPTSRTCRRTSKRGSTSNTGRELPVWHSQPPIEKPTHNTRHHVAQHEHYYRHTYATKAELVVSVDKWMNFYNTTRRHSSIGNQSPNAFERSLRTAAA